jgi:hypothetical protein
MLENIENRCFDVINLHSGILLLVAAFGVVADQRLRQRCFVGARVHAIGAGRTRLVPRAEMGAIGLCPALLTLVGLGRRSNAGLPE